MFIKALKYVLQEIAVSIWAIIAVIALIGGIIVIISKTGDNLLLSLATCIIYVFIVLFVYFKIGKW